MAKPIRILCAVYVAMVLAGLLLMGADEQSAGRIWMGAGMVFGINLLYMALGVWNEIVATLFGNRYGK